MAGIEQRSIPGPNGDVPCLVNIPRNGGEPLPVADAATALAAAFAR